MPLPAPSAAVAAGLPPALRRKVALRLLPYLFLIYIVAFLDRANVSYAALGMAHDLGFSAQVMGAGFGIFFWGYFIFEVPSTLMVERWSARKWMSRIMITWGLVASSLGFIHSAHAFLVLRFLLGLGEAGFFPGMIVYLSHWFTEQDKAKAIGLFYTAVPIAFIVGAPLSGVIMRLHWLGLAGWRWVFLLEGVPAIVLGIANLWMLTDWPRQAPWLTEAERELLEAKLDGERSSKTNHVPALGWLRHPVVLKMTVIYFFACTGSYGFGLWLPTMLKGLTGFSVTTITLLAALPYVASLIGVVLVGWNSDRTGERRWHVAIPFFVMAAGLSLGSVFRVYGLGWTLFGFILVGAGVYSYIPSFWALLGRHLSGTAAAVAIGLVNSLGNLGGFFGPYLMGYVQTHTGSFRVAMGILMGVTIIAGGLVLTLPQVPTKGGQAARGV